VQAACLKHGAVLAAIVAEIGAEQIAAWIVDHERHPLDRSLDPPHPGVHLAEQLAQIEQRISQWLGQG